MNRLAARPDVVAALVLGTALSAILAVELRLTHGSAGTREFVAAVAVAVGALALARERHPGRALTAGLAICAGAAVVAVLTDRPSQPGVTATAALLVLGASYLRTARPRTGGPAAAAGAVLLVASRAGLRPSLVLPTALLGLLAWGTALGLGLWSRALDQRRQDAVEGARREERLLLARELHDVVAHHVAAIVVHSQAARLGAARHPDQAYAALGEIEAAGGDALTAMRQVIGLLRDSDDVPGPPPGPEPLRTLVERFRALGPAVDVRLPDQAAWPPEISTTVYRIVQESLTNIVQHAPAVNQVRITVEESLGELRLEITDDGPAGLSWRPRPGGYGLVGMRERVEALGGRFDAGPRPDGGWAVHARIPRTRVPA